MEQRLILLAILSLALPAQAQADPQKKQASPCPPGFAALQNSDTCVRISGRVRADALVGSPQTRTSNSVETRASGRVQLDVRKQTEYGPLRAVVRVDGVGR
jgi:hypothetical protein